MICFLTSRTDLPGHEELNPANRFIDELRRVLPNPCRALDICSDPDAWEKTDFYASLTRLYFENAGFRFDSFRVLDGRNADQAEALVRDADLLILGGGHVPTQNRFFQQIGLRELMANYDGVVVGISAGSMNSAEMISDGGESVGAGE